MRIAQVDISPEELGRGNSDPLLSIHGDIVSVVSQLSSYLSTWAFPSTTPWASLLAASTSKNLSIANRKASTPTTPLTYHRSFTVIKSTLESLASSLDDLVYVSEGANTMDISRSIFSVSQPRQRLDAGTYATMGVGLGYAIAAEMAYNHTREARAAGGRKRIVAIEGDSAFGFSLPEVETMARYRLPIIVVVVNNGGVYRGISTNDPSWRDEVWEKDPDGKRREARLTSTALGFETEYDVVSRGLGGRGWKVRDEKELVDAVREAWGYTEGPSVINMIIASGVETKLEFGWLGKGEKGSSKL